MNLLQQFPDVSMQVRRLNQKRNRMDIRSTKGDNDSGNELELYYDNEFRKWHTKLMFIIVFIITCLLAALIGVSKLF